MPLTLVSTAPASTVAIGGGISGTTTGGGAASPISVFNAATLGAKIDGTAMDTTIAGIINNQIAGAKGTLYFPLAAGTKVIFLIGFAVSSVPQ